jgi:hypothetical protein
MTNELNLKLRLLLGQAITLTAQAWEAAPKGTAWSERIAEADDLLVGLLDDLRNQARNLEVR